ncbi:excinuclease ABC A subunit [Chitinophaga dinghuensis]|uniref:UvrABC system protein A n=1 Tax=Chitinophaga dinghuensis TaxID=1539050 RepID=A0A327VKM8_9BACT|nr:excinuclease ABC subunit UvrA [Chitinophaga dinghuensis]RAJ73755.1 excinuclease ABC A subunit [Chitinophaga dinghuensis]
MKPITITGARQNNLKNLSLEIPRGCITVFTGVSGSGKSSLVFETIGAEAQRQINETQHSFLRNRLLHLGLPEVDKIENLNYPIIINQQRLGGNIRSSVGTATDISASLRLLFSRIGQPFVGYSNIFSPNHPSGMCPTCEGLGFVKSIDEHKLIDRTKSLQEGAIRFPTFQPGGWRWTRYANSGYFDINKKLQDYTKKEWELLLHAPAHKPEHPGPNWGKTVQYEGIIPRIEKAFLKKDSKEQDLRSKSVASIVSEKPCPSCKGQRLNEKILSCKINGHSIADCTAMPVDDLLDFLREINAAPYEAVLQEVCRKLGNMVTIGLQYLTLDRITNTLSGGESQRIKMVRHLGNSLTELLYIFDEPSVGLHPADVDKIIRIIRLIRDKGNTVMIVEHDPDIIRIADHVIDIGPGSGVHGGEIVYQGDFQGLKNSSGKTGLYFSHPRTYNAAPRTAKEFLQVKDASLHNLQHIHVRIPLSVMTVVTGVAGSGKSSLISDELPLLYPDVKVIDQSLFPGNVRSSCLTYLGISDHIRALLAQANDKSAALFSRNSEGACPACKGLGVLKIDMAFMDDTETPCDVCNGSGFSPEVLPYRYQGKNIVDIMNMTVEEAAQFFTDKHIQQQFQLLTRLGLDYITLGQRLDTYSGGERQRLKLSKELNNRNAIIVLDEPSTGLHPADTARLLHMMNEMVNAGNTLIVIEHNMDIIAQADWIIDIGPGAGKYGGRIVFEGTVSAFINHGKTITATYLQQHVGTLKETGDL